MFLDILEIESTIRLCKIDENICTEFLERMVQEIVVKNGFADPFIRWPAMETVLQIIAVAFSVLLSVLRRVICVLLYPSTSFGVVVAFGQDMPSNR